MEPTNRLASIMADLVAESRPKAAPKPKNPPRPREAHVSFLLECGGRISELEVRITPERVDHGPGWDVPIRTDVGWMTSRMTN